MLIVLSGRSDRKLLKVVSALLGVRVLNIGDPAYFRKFPTFSGGLFIFFGNSNPLKRLGFRA